MDKVENEKTFIVWAIATLFFASCILVGVGCAEAKSYAGTASSDPAKNMKSQPEDAVFDFYAAINAKNCLKAVQLRPGYAPERCEAISDAKVTRCQVEFAQEEQAVVALDLTYQEAGKPQVFSGRIRLQMTPDGWVIDTTSYNSKLGLRDYEGQYLKPSGPPPTPQVELPKPEATSAAGLTFGSQKILDACWSPERLRGSKEDKKVRRPVKNPFRSPPSRVTPNTKLPSLTPDLRNSIRHVVPNGGQKIIALTFDLCERTTEVAGYDAEIFNWLRAKKIKATFYAGGKWMHSHPEKAKQLMADPLFEIGNHGWTHGNMRVLHEEAMNQQVFWTQAQYELLWEELAQSPCAKNAGEQEMNKIPKVPLTFRFPYGTCKSEALQILGDAGLPAIQWDVVTGDPAPKQTAKGIAAIVLKQAKPGSIIICHANGRGHGTAEALRLFVPQLQARGFRFVTVSELLSLGKTVATKDCFELRPDDNTKYDEKFGEGTE